MITRRVVFLVWLIWTIVGLVSALASFADIKKYNLPNEFGLQEVFGYVASYWLWIIITLGFIQLMSKRQLSVLSLLFLLFIVQAIWLPLYFTGDFLLSTFITENKASDWWLNLKNSSGFVTFTYMVMYAFTLAVCWAFVVATQSHLTKLQNIELQQKQIKDALILSEQKMQLMQSQLSPHFLFNCLGAVSGLARYGNKASLVKAVASMGDLLRFTVTHSSSSLILLDDEIRFVKDYLSLQKLRFEDKFSHQFSVDVQHESIMCPPFSLQPLVENIFRHAVEISECNIAFAIDITQLEDRLIFTVKNQKPLKQKTNNGAGTGIKNLTTRLEHLYGEDYCLNTDSDNTSYCISVSLPIH